jgi:hypothetical protein
VLAIGVRQQSMYQRKTLLERRRHRMACVPVVIFTRPGGIWKMSVPPAGSSTSARSRKRAIAWQSYIVAFDIGPYGCGINATRVEILSRRRFIHQLGTFAARSGPAH